MKRLLLHLQAVFAAVLFFFKKRAGFMDLGLYVLVPGVVTHIDSGVSTDGDFSFDLKVDAGGERWCRLGELSTNGPGVIHCEVMPRARLSPAISGVVDALREGQHVLVSGRWAFDGSHSDAYMAGERSLALELLAAAPGRQPNPKGWTEIHPVTFIKVLS